MAVTVGPHRALVGLATIAPALVWTVFALWNTVLPNPPRYWGLTPNTASYLLMLPAAALVAWQRPTPLPPGTIAFALFVMWLSVGLGWHGLHVGSEVAKQYVVLALAVLVAAQVHVAGRAAISSLAIAIMAVGTSVSFWVVRSAWTSGFDYRAGLAINPNFPAMLAGVGFMVAVGYFQLVSRPLWRRLCGAVALATWYTCLLLGSRGILIALVAGTACTLLRVRPSRRRTLSLAIGLVAMVAVAQSPQLIQGLGRLASPGPPTISTAISRFGEEGTGSLNLRSALWEAALTHVAASPAALLFGSGFGYSAILSERANPVFFNVHNTYLQLVVDVGLMGLVCLLAMVRGIHRAGLAHRGDAAVWFGVLVFWLTLGLTVTVVESHVFWMCVAISAMAARGPSPAPASPPGPAANPHDQEARSTP